MDGDVRRATMNALNGQPFLSAPGTNYSYSNAGYMLLGYAIEPITGMSYGRGLVVRFV